MCMIKSAFDFFCTGLILRLVDTLKGNQNHSLSTMHSHWPVLSSSNPYRNQVSSLISILAKSAISKKAKDVYFFSVSRDENYTAKKFCLITHILQLHINHFFWSEPGVTPQYRIGSTHLAPKSHLVSGKEVVFFEMEWPGFEPRTSSIRRGCSIHSTTPHLAILN